MDVNMTDKIREAVKAARANGSNRIKITFGKDNTDDVYYLIGMANHGIVKISDMDRLTLMAVHASQCWEQDRNRTLFVGIGEKYEDEWFVGRMARALVAVEAVAPSDQKVPH